MWQVKEETEVTTEDAQSSRAPTMVSFLSGDTVDVTGLAPSAVVGDLLVQLEELRPAPPGSAYQILSDGAVLEEVDVLPVASFFNAMTVRLPYKLPFGKPVGRTGWSAAGVFFDVCNLNDDRCVEITAMEVGCASYAKPPVTLNLWARVANDSSHGVEATSDGWSAIGSVEVNAVETACILQLDVPVSIPAGAVCGFLLQGLGAGNRPVRTCNLPAKDLLLEVKPGRSTHEPVPFAIGDSEQYLETPAGALIYHSF